LYVKLEVVVIVVFKCCIDLVLLSTI
jgi:hypothetical protein